MQKDRNSSRQMFRENNLWKIPQRAEKPIVKNSSKSFCLAVWTLRVAGTHSVFESWKTSLPATISIRNASRGSWWRSIQKVPPIISSLKIWKLMERIKGVNVSWRYQLQRLIQVVNTTEAQITFELPLSCTTAIRQIKQWFDSNLRLHAFLNWNNVCNF